MGALLQERHKIQVLRSVATKDQIHAIYLADNKVYYIHATINDKGSCLTLNISEWLCRFHVTVQCVGLVATENDMLYAVMSYPNESVSCLALNESMEVDLPTKQVPSVVLLGKDAVTHGCHMVTSTGLLVRARWMQLQNHNIPTLCLFRSDLSSAVFSSEGGSGALSRMQCHACCHLQATGAILPSSGFPCSTY